MRCARLSLLGLTVVLLTCGNALGEGWSVRSLWPFGKQQQQQQQTGPLLDAPTSAKDFSQTRTKKTSWPKIKMPSLWPKKKKPDPRYISKSQVTKQPTAAQRIKGGAQKAWNNTAGRLMPSKPKSQPVPTNRSSGRSSKSSWLPTSWFKPIKKPKGPQTPAEWIGQPRLDF